MKSFIVSTVCLLWLTSMASTALAAASNPGVTSNEWRLLPPVCLYVEGGPEHQSETARRMRAADITWVHMHHYCRAIVQTMRTYQHTIDRSVARQYIRAAIGNLNYTIQRSRPGFLLRPDMFVRKAALQIRLDNLVGAADTARQLITESPELPDGYIALANVQLKAGQRAQARKTLELGDEKVTDRARFDALKQTLAFD